MDWLLAQQTNLDDWIQAIIIVLIVFGGALAAVLKKLVEFFGGKKEEEHGGGWVELESEEDRPGSPLHPIPPGVHPPLPPPKLPERASGKGVPKLERVEPRGERPETRRGRPHVELPPEHHRHQEPPRKPRRSVRSDSSEASWAERQRESKAGPNRQTAPEARPSGKGKRRHLPSDEIQKKEADAFSHRTSLESVIKQVAESAGAVEQRPEAAAAITAASLFPSGDPSALRRAIVLSEVLSPPVGLRAADQRI